MIGSSVHEHHQAILRLLCLALTLAVAPASIGSGQPLEVGLQAPPLRLPSAIVHVAATGQMMLELTLTHQRIGNRSVTRLGLLGLRRLEPVERDGLSMTPILGAGLEVGRIAVNVYGSTSTTSMAALKLVAGGEHWLERPSLTLFARVWHAVGLQPQGLGYGAALGVRLPLRFPR